VLQSASILQANQGRQDRITALHEFVAARLRELSARSYMISYRRGIGEGLPLNGILWGEVPSITVLDAKIQPNGLYLLRLGKCSMATADGNSSPIIPGGPLDNNDTAYSWTPLVRDVKGVRWQFRDFGEVPWIEEWVNIGSKPRVVSFSITFAGDAQPVLMEFWLPRLYQVSLAMPQTGQTNAP
jgi:hypothetical protein